MLDTDATCVRRRCTSASDSSAIPRGIDLASADGVERRVYRFPLQQRADVRVRLMRVGEVAEVSALAESAYADDFPLTEGYRAEIAAVAERARDHQVWVATDAASGMLLGTTSTTRAGRAISPLARDGELDFRFLGVASSARRRGSARCSWGMCCCSRASAASRASC